MPALSPLSSVLQTECAFQKAAPQSSQFRCLDVHPSEPWALLVRAASGGRQYLQLWNLSQNILVREINLAEVDAHLGQVCDARFYDTSVAAVKDRGVTRRGPQRAAAEFEIASNWVLLLGTGRTLLLDHVNLRHKAIHTGVEHGARFCAPLASAASEARRPEERSRSKSVNLRLPAEAGPSLMAFAGAASLTVLNCESWAVTTIFCAPEAHAKPITALTDCGAFIVTGGEDGTMAVWQLQMKKPAKILEKAHGMPVLHFSYNESTSHLVSMASNGKDGEVICWTVPTFQELWRVHEQVPCHAVQHCRHPSMAVDAVWLSSGVPERPGLLSCLRGASMDNKKSTVSKIVVSNHASAITMQMIVHPYQPHLVVVNTGSDLVVLHLGTFCTPSAQVQVLEVEAGPLAVSMPETYAGDEADPSPGSSSRRESRLFSNSSASGTSPTLGSSDRSDSSPQPPKEARLWEPNEVGEWLQSIGMGTHAAAFVDNEIDGRTLLKLNAEDLREDLGIKSGLQAKKILSKIELLTESQEQAASVVASPSKPDGSSSSQTNRKLFYAANKSLWCKSFSFKESSDVDGEKAKRVAKLSFLGVTDVRLSPRGDLIAVLFREEQRYVVHSTADRVPITSGHAISFEWAAGVAGDQYVVLQSTNNYKQELQAVVDKFNIKPKKGIALLISDKKSSGSAKDVAMFLRSTDGLDLKMTGEYLGGYTEFIILVLTEYTNSFDFRGLGLDQAIRMFLQGFRLPGESQVIDRIMTAFATTYVEHNPGLYQDPSNCFLVSFAIIMLNTDAHNPAIEDKRRMSKEQFISQLRDSELDPEMLTGIYNRIKSNEIILKGEQPGAPKAKRLPEDDWHGSAAVHSLYESEDTMVGYIEHEADQPVVQIFGGHLLGVTVKSKPKKRGPKVEGSEFSWYDWATRKSVGTPLPPPRLVSWDPNLVHCLVAFADEFYVYATLPKFELLCKAPGCITSVCWDDSVLYYSTHTLVCSFYPTLGEHSSVVLAALASRRFLPGGSKTALQPWQPPPVRRLPGSLAVLAAQNGRLVAIDSEHRLCAIPITHPAVQLRRVISVSAPVLDPAETGPESDAARELVMDLALQLSPAEHDHVGQYLSNRGLAALACELPGVTHLQKFCILLQNGMWPDAASELDKLHAEFSQRNHELNDKESCEVHLVQCELLLGRVAEEASKDAPSAVALAMYQRAAQLDQSARRQIALHYAHTGDKAALRAVCTDEGGTGSGVGEELLVRSLM